MAFRCCGCHLLSRVSNLGRRYGERNLECQSSQGQEAHQEARGRGPVNLKGQGCSLLALPAWGSISEDSGAGTRNGENIQGERKKTKYARHWKEEKENARALKISKGGA